MKRLILLFFAAFIAISALADERFTLKGSVRDRATSSYIIEAKVECINELDSVIGEAWAESYDYDYHRHAATTRGIFWMEIPREKGKYTLRFTHEDYDTITAPLDLTHMGQREYDREIGVYYMDRRKVTQLKEVEVTASKIMFYNRGDTIVYNADAFQLAEGSMLDALIEQLPGVEIREGGQIYVNGKFVKSLLLNGKDFFKGNNELMLENLAAYTVKNVEVYKKQTDRARFLELDDDSNKELVMDVKLKKEYIGGWLINTEVAGGNQDRYLGRLFAMNFGALSEFTIIGNVNNLNDESRPTSDDGWDPENMLEGELRHQQGGIDYSIENEQASRKIQGNIIVKNEHSLQEQLTNSINFLPDMNTYSNSNMSGISRNFDLDTRHELYFETGGTATTITPQLRWNHSRHTQQSSSSSSRDADHQQLINSTLSEVFAGNDFLTFGADWRTTIKIPKTSDALDIYAKISHQSTKTESESFNIINYGNNDLTPVGRRQSNDNNPTHYTCYQLGGKYTLVFNSKCNLNLQYEYENERNKQTSSFYLGQLNAGYTGDYTLENLYKLKMEFDPTNSNVSSDMHYLHNLECNLSWTPDKRWSFTARLPMAFYYSKLRLNQDGKEYMADYRSNALDNMEFSIDYSKYNEDVGLMSCLFRMARYLAHPNLSNMITIPNTRDPLTQFVGNPDLKASVTNSYSFTWQKSNRHNFTFYFYTALTFTDRAITSGYTLDINTGKRTYKSYNVDGNLRAYNSIYLSWYSKNDWRISADCSYNYSRTHSMVGSDETEPQLITMYSHTFAPRLLVGKYFNGRSKYILLTLTPSFRHNKSSDALAANISPTSSKYILSGKYEFPYGWSISTSFHLNVHRGYADPEMDRTKWIWNGRISKSFMKGQLLASVVAYDLLCQNDSYHFYLTPTSSTEYFTNTIPRYMLLDLQYKINIQPKKKINQSTYYY